MFFARPDPGHHPGSALLEIVIVLMTFTCLSCSGTQSSRAKGGADSNVHAAIQLPTANPAPPPGTCTIVGTILALDTSRAVASSAGPCTSAPCDAFVRVDSILGYGAAFPAPLGVTQTIRVHFTFTLAPTEKLFPSMSPALPGLGVGSVFSASVGAGPDQNVSGASSYVIGNYSVR